jgi:hypothetical protein
MTLDADVISPRRISLLTAFACAAALNIQNIT